MQNKQLIFEFFLLFSKFEYSLKIVGFHKGDGDARPNWIKFTESIKNDFDKESDDELLESVNYILTNPPKKQIIKEGVLKWSENPPDSNSYIELLLKYVCRVRNNLFHGGKYKDRYLKQEDRSKKLLIACNSILRNCLQISNEVREAFEKNFTNPS